MKKFILPILLVVSIFSACDEIPPVVTGSMGIMEPPDVEDQQRQVLIEEFTGVRCVNCPAGSAAIEDLLNAHGPRLVAVSIHESQNFSVPLPQNDEDFRTPEGTAIYNFVGPPEGFPSAVVDRKKFPGETGLQVGSPKWAGYIAQELAIPPKVKIAIEKEYDSSTRNLKATITLLVQENITDPDVRLSVMITESGIVDAQETPNGLEENYTHKHMLRGMMTNYDGSPVTVTLTAGTTVSKSFNMDLSDKWVAENCKIVAFVNLAGATKEVLQVNEAYVIDP
ncbi:MAG: Omp28 family outer membrane lipoprotein [Lewinellaceae bacterium]|nr:Omp28 family outer membrane lipoprotein [Saprospiraceae bacterium]MCB9339855.1 Omp28 family outer membrane lipoprotein [Lewinellaceae bacterium]